MARPASTLERARDDEAALPVAELGETREEGEAEKERVASDLPGSNRRAWGERLGRFAAVGAGGFLGANARVHLGIWAAAQWGTGFPWGTLLINLVGSFILGFYLTLVTERFIGRPLTRLFVATGLLGAFTTFSTFSLETVRLLEGGVPLLSLAYVLGSIALGLLAGVAGILCGHAL